MFQFFEGYTVILDSPIELLIESTDFTRHIAISE